MGKKFIKKITRMVQGIAKELTYIPMENTEEIMRMAKGMAKILFGINLFSLLFSFYFFVSQIIHN